ncbi:MAG: hypothetical protein HY343_00290 [Lentisphaerae bacterium]|nr:hypothetical protein [Lentisphaerota bacterium]
MKSFLKMAILAGGVSCLMACGTPPKPVPVDAGIARSTASARSMFSLGYAGRAAEQYQAALLRAREIDDAAQIAQNAYNLAACRVVAGEFAQARELLDEAKGEFRRVGRDPLELRLLEARVARFQGNTEEAVILARAALQQPAAGQAPPLSAHLRLLLADIACDKNDIAQARSELTGAETLLGKIPDPSIQADAILVRSRLLEFEKKPKEAAGALDAAVDLLRKADRYHDMALALEKAGIAHEAGGDGLAAGDRYFRSARSFLAARDDAAARRVLARALPLAARTGDPDLQRKLDRLQKELPAEPKKTADTKP